MSRQPTALRNLVVAVRGYCARHYLCRTTCTRRSPSQVPYEDRCADRQCCRSAVSVVQGTARGRFTLAVKRMWARAPRCSDGRGRLAGARPCGAASEARARARAGAQQHHGGAGRPDGCVHRASGRARAAPGRVPGRPARARAPAGAGTHGVAAVAGVRPPGPPALASGARAGGAAAIALSSSCKSFYDIWVVFALAQRAQGPAYA